ncbi:Nucleoside 2-deoxyribosyltransferase [Paramagnetospirillum magnetotacticum MS-1]|uniref:Nucleoside 2-deoxyribosyltransferase n=1 Tax=Paramagnetospirillum magnetotacticum MS-1 TaxID=272627 RepID=A0A0C2YUX6_PARME|nr:nucleoside 2-deoxyribosyltransferase [Paramagnetospirillum magnetotacticum]KIL98500.1 Nucleoside 2-deoxyribosyltransferase [Paramagnetospirillum magnetotacticum MS-1]
MTHKPKAYLAGPAVFHPAAKALLDYLAEMCGQHGMEGVAPFEPEAEHSALPPAELAALIRSGNMARIKECDVVIACVSPFRGPGACPGTTWEMGYAEGLGKPVVAWSEDMRPYKDRVPHDQDEDGRSFCRQHGMLVEDFGLAENLMYAAGPCVVQPDFEAALKIAGELAGSHRPAAG